MHVWWHRGNRISSDFSPMSMDLFYSYLFDFKWLGLLTRDTIFTGTANYHCLGKKKKGSKACFLLWLYSIQQRQRLEKKHSGGSRPRPFRGWGWIKAQQSVCLKQVSISWSCTEICLKDCIISCWSGVMTKDIKMNVVDHVKVSLHLCLKALCGISEFILPQLLKYRLMQCDVLSEKLLWPLI